MKQVLFKRSRDGGLFFSPSVSSNLIWEQGTKLALPEALKPVSQTVQPFWPRRVSRSSWVTAPTCGVRVVVT